MRGLRCLKGALCPKISDAFEESESDRSNSKPFVLGSLPKPGRQTSLSGRSPPRYRVIGENFEEAFPSNEYGFSFAVEPTTRFGGILTDDVQEQVGVGKVAAM